MLNRFVAAFLLERFPTVLVRLSTPSVVTRFRSLRGLIVFKFCLYVYSGMVSKTHFRC
jgi:hypothetical protein